jgi:hypothetical protein
MTSPLPNLSGNSALSSGHREPSVSRVQVKGILEMAGELDGKRPAGTLVPCAYGQSSV